MYLRISAKTHFQVSSKLFHKIITVEQVDGSSYHILFLFIVLLGHNKYNVYSCFYGAK